MLGYAGDLILMAPSLIALQEMLDACSNYCLGHDILLNEKKSITYIMSKKSRDVIPPPLSIETRDVDGILVSKPLP